MKLSAIIEPLVAAGVSGEIILNTIRAFEYQQIDALEKRRESDAKRQADKRKRDSHVTSRDVTVTVSSHASASPAPDLENKQTNKQENKKDTSPSARSTRGTRIPADFEPDTEWAQSQGMTPTEAGTEAAQFLDFWQSKPGSAGCKLDWLGTWRVWVRNAMKRYRRPGSTAPPPGRRQNAVEAMNEIFREKGWTNEPVSAPSDSDNVEFLPPRIAGPKASPDDVFSNVGRRFRQSDH